MKLTPLADNVVLKRFEAEEKTASGIILSTANKEKSALCEVVAVDKKTFGNIIQEEIDRINGERKSKVKA